ncbi:MAG: TonB-dependent receptor, partial [candidate division WOR-3 bacterium]
RLDFFPTLHLSYQLPRGQQMMASYARRINRPTARNLRPYLIWTDPNTRTEGNPELKPEFVHSFDFGYLLPIGGNRLSAEIYYRITQNAIDHIRSVDSENIIVSIPRNVGSSSALGG